MLSRLLLFALLSASLACTGLALVSFLKQRSDAARLVIDPAERTITRAWPGQSSPVSFPVQNLSRHTARIVGFEAC